VDTGLIHDGPDDEEFLDVRRLLLAPRQHWSWVDLISGTVILLFFSGVFIFPWLIPSCCTSTEGCVFRGFEDLGGHGYSPFLLVDTWAMTLS
jgi:hypothetical protein